MRAVERKARTAHRCVTCNRVVQPGEQYIDYTAFPSDGLWFGDRPTRFAECRDCPAERAARRSGVSV